MSKHRGFDKLVNDFAIELALQKIETQLLNSDNVLSFGRCAWDPDKIVVFKRTDEPLGLPSAIDGIEVFETVAKFTGFGLGKPNHGTSR